MTAPTIEALYEQYHAPIYSRVLYLVRDRERAEELTDDVFIKAWRYLPRLKHTGNLFGWLLMIATRTVIDAERIRRKHAERVTFASLDQEGMPDFPDERGDPEQWVLRCEVEREALVMRIIQRLNPRYQEVIFACAEGEHCERRVLYQARRAVRDHLQMEGMKECQHT